MTRPMMVSRSEQGKLAFISCIEVVIMRRNGANYHLIEAKLMLFTVVKFMIVLSTPNICEPCSKKYTKMITTLSLKISNCYHLTLWILTNKKPTFSKSWKVNSCPDT